jgi:hypothetical protein
MGVLGESSTREHVDSFTKDRPLSCRSPAGETPRNHRFLLLYLEHENRGGLKPPLWNGANMRSLAKAAVARVIGGKVTAGRWYVAWYTE